MSGKDFAERFNRAVKEKTDWDAMSGYLESLRDGVPSVDRDTKDTVFKALRGVCDPTTLEYVDWFDEEWGDCGIVFSVEDTYGARRLLRKTLEGNTMYGDECVEVEAGMVTVYVRKY